MRISDWSSDVCSSDLAASTAIVVRSDAVDVIAAICTGFAMPTRNGPSTVPWPSSFSSFADMLADCRPGMISTVAGPDRSEEHTSELQSLMRISYAVFCLKKKIKNTYYQTKYRTTEKQLNVKRK